MVKWNEMNNYNYNYNNKYNYIYIYWLKLIININTSQIFLHKNLEFSSYVWYAFNISMKYVNFHKTDLMTKNHLPRFWSFDLLSFYGGGDHIWNSVTKIIPHLIYEIQWTIPSKFTGIYNTNHKQIRSQKRFPLP